VNGGELKKLPVKLIHGEYVEQNTKIIILKTMYAQIARDFANCPRPYEISDSELRFYYDLLVGELIELQRRNMREKLKHGPSM
jgi:hypothetical protein